MKQEFGWSVAEYRCGRILKDLVVLVQLKDTSLRPREVNQLISILGSI